MRRQTNAFLSFLLIGFAMVASVMAPFAHRYQAMAQTITPVTSDSLDLLGKLNALALPDIQNAEVIAKASGDVVADQCYLAVIDVMTKIQAAQGTTPTNLPKVAMITDFQKARGAVNALRPTNNLFVACAALKAQLSQDLRMLPAQGASAILGILQ